MQWLIETASYMAHGYCLLWQPWLVVLYAGSDLLIFAAYMAIPLAILQVARRRPDLKYRWVLWLFVAFITLCGLTHLVSVVTLWLPVYPLHGAVKLVTGLVSAATAAVLFMLVPKLVALPSPAQLEEANTRLRREVAAHRETLEKLRQAQQELEGKVAQRTEELAESNRRLTVMAREAVHRKKNLLSVVSSLARQTARGSADLGSFLERFSGRLEALSTATATVSRAPGARAALLGEVIAAQLEPVLETYGARVDIAGPEVEVRAEAAQQIALAIHELATNAIKFGALAGSGGRIGISWEVAEDAEGPVLRLTWQETGAGGGGGPEAEAESEGFGTRLVMEAVPAMLQGRASREVTGEGLAYALCVPVAALEPDRAADESELAASADRAMSAWADGGPERSGAG